MVMMINLIKRQADSTADDFTTNDIQTIQNGILFKTIGISLAVSSGIFIGASFVLKKKGHLEANKQLVQGTPAGEGHAYLLNRLWWIGMILMAIGELCNFVAYVFAQAILITPLGALSVVISAILSSIFLKETLNLQGGIGCALCIIGATIIVMYAPVQRIASSIEEFRELFFSPVFLAYTIFCVVFSIATIWFLGPKYGTKHMVIYIGVCSLIGSLSVVTTQGLGIAILRTIQGENQFTHWFLYFLMAFIAITALVEINYLNKALNIFNTSMVTPVYYVIFTSLTILSSSILFQGFKAPPEAFLTMIFGFLIICTGIILLQTSRKVTNAKGIASSTKSLLNTDDDDQNPGASEIRASFAGIRRYSQNYNRSINIKDLEKSDNVDNDNDNNNSNNTAREIGKHTTLSDNQQKPTEQKIYTEQVQQKPEDQTQKMELESQTEPSPHKRSDTADTATSKFLEDFSFDQDNQNIVVDKDHKSTSKNNNRKSQDSINMFDQKKLKIKSPDNDDLQGLISHQ